MAASTVCSEPAGKVLIEKTGSLLLIFFLLLPISIFQFLIFEFSNFQIFKLFNSSSFIKILAVIFFFERAYDNSFMRGGVNEIMILQINTDVRDLVGIDFEKNEIAFF